MNRFWAELIGWWQGKKTILGGGLVMLAAVAGVWTGKLPADQALIVLGFGLSIAGYGAKANRHQAELLAALQAVAQAGNDYRSGGAAKAITYGEAVASEELPKALKAYIDTLPIAPASRMPIGGMPVGAEPPSQTGVK